MSVVVNVIFGGQSYLMCDGRARNNKTGVIISEHQQKIEQISQFVAIGFTGTLEHAKYLIEKAQKSSNEYCDLFANKLSEVAICDKYAKYIDATFLVTGISKNGLLETYTMGSTTNFIPSKAAQLTSIGDTEKLKFEPFFNIRFGQTHGYLDHRILHVMNKYIERLAAKTDSINTNTSHIIIKLPR